MSSTRMSRRSKKNDTTCSPLCRRRFTKNVHRRPPSRFLAGCSSSAGHADSTITRISNGSKREREAVELERPPIPRALTQCICVPGWPPPTIKHNPELIAVEVGPNKPLTWATESRTLRSRPGCRSESLIGVGPVGPITALLPIFLQRLRPLPALIVKNTCMVAVPYEGWTSLGNWITYPKIVFLPQTSCLQLHNLPFLGVLVIL
ncbi:unnamed protein product [Arctogadus glacialis]